MLPLFRIIYMSESLMPQGNAEFASAINEILDYSRGWNDENLVTGALMFSVGRFAQVLEGPDKTIKELFGHIACDNRHHSLILLEHGAIAERAFENWSMAYTDGGEQLDLIFASLSDPSRSSKAAAILAMLRHVVVPEPATA